MSNAMYLGTTIDTPAVAPGGDGYTSAIGKAVNHLRHGRKVPYDTARELMDEGIDLPALEASTRRQLND